MKFFRFHSAHRMNIEEPRHIVKSPVNGVRMVDGVLYFDNNVVIHSGVWFLFRIRNIENATKVFDDGIDPRLRKSNSRNNQEKTNPNKFHVQFFKVKISNL